MEKITTSADQTENFAKDFAKGLKPGAIVALYGDLGAGKTTFIKGLAKGLNYAGEVTSPTFIFARTYHLNDPAKPRPRRASPKSLIKDLHHIDLYRSEGKSDLSSIGLEEFLADPNAVSVIEWAEKIEDGLSKNVTKVKIDALGEDKRKITVA